MADKKTRVKKLTPMDIHNKEFKHRGFKGYDRREVDGFLDKVVSDYGDALDETSDLKNKVVKLNDKVDKLQAQVDKYNQMDKSAKEAVTDAKEKAQKIIDDARNQAAIDTDYQKQQQDVLKSDYKRLKQEVSQFRKHVQKLLQSQINDLNDQGWQHALDRYFHTDRFYPPDGSEPIPSASEDDIDGVDSDDSDDVDSVDEPKPMTGDSPSHETLNAKPKLKNNSGAKIIFPDDNKDNN